MRSREGSLASGALPAASPRLDAADGVRLLEVARAAIDHGLAYGRPIEIDLSPYAGALREPRATFVTLHLDGELRGCIGELEAQRPLVASVAHGAFQAAFRDPRFAPVSAPEGPHLDIHVSVLSPLERLEVGSEEELLLVLRAGRDGLLLDDGAVHRATFLPAVWYSLPDPRAFVCELKRKAGLASDAWPTELRAWRYEVEEFGSGRGGGRP
jgi:AmmeMemoRadiSam system protein A